MTFALVAVNSPAAAKRAFSYIVPQHLKIEAGQAVWVPFGQRILQGIVAEISLENTSGLPASQLKEISGIIEGQKLSSARLSTALFMVNYYMAPYFPTLSCFMPPAFSLPPRDIFKTTQDLIILENTQEQALFNYINEASPTSQMLKNHFPAGYSHTLNSLIKQGYVQKVHSLALPRVQAKIQDIFYLNISHEQAESILEGTPERFTRKKEALFLLLSQNEVSTTDNPGIRSTLNDFAKRGWVKKSQSTVWREIEIPQIKDKTHTLNSAQITATEAISQAIVKGQVHRFLLHGVTGSGKTEVYMQAAASCLRENKSVIVLVPEIALCPQTIARFNARFPGQVAVLHSELTIRERFDQWQQISAGTYKIVVGARSAIFAPVQNLGMIVIDEEHEATYKQQEIPPFYHARTVADKLCTESHAVLVLGSATPSMESYASAKRGYNTLITLPQRVGTSLPSVELVDMREEAKQNARTIISLRLEEAIKETLEQGKQVLLMHNRRGLAYFAKCPACGYVPACRACEVPLAVHEKGLLCHRCGKKYQNVAKCRMCGNEMKTHGYGTENIYSALQKIFPSARIMRWDSDSARQYGQNSLFSQAQQDSDIIIGTQMVSKGLDLENVALSAVMLSEIGESLPDFRSFERIFQLCCQTAGRAGRQKNGRAILQTFNPASYPVNAAAHHNYELFFEKELEFRKKAFWPPFCHVATVTAVHSNAAYAQNLILKSQRAASEAAMVLKDFAAQITAATPAFIHKKDGKYRYSFAIKSQNPQYIIKKAGLDNNLTIDIDAYGAV